MNFFLYGAAINMSGINLHMTQNSYAGAWKPRNDSDGNQVVRPTYYAYAAMAQLIGSGNGTTQITRLSSDTMPAAYDDYVRYVSRYPTTDIQSCCRDAHRGPLPYHSMCGDILTVTSMYAGYGEGRLTSVVIINAMQANASEARKDSLNVSLSLEGYEGQTLFLSYLTAPGADSTNETVWNGMHYSDNHGTAPLVADTVQNITIGQDGTALVSVRDSQAVIAYIGARLGTNQVLLNSTIPDDTDDGGTNNTSTGNSTESSESAALVSVECSKLVAVLIFGFWTSLWAGSYVWFI